MKTIISFFSSLTLFIISTIIFGTTITSLSYAQQKIPKELDPVKGIEETYRCFEGDYGTISYFNSKYIEDSIRKVFPPIGPGSVVDGTFSIKTESNEIIMKTVWSVISAEKIQMMAERDEFIQMIWQINQLGQSLTTSFCINSNSLITAEEIELLERELTKNLTFIPVDVEVIGNASTFVVMRFTLKEVLDKTVDIYKPWGIGKNLIDND